MTQLNLLVPICRKYNDNRKVWHLRVISCRLLSLRKIQYYWPCSNTFPHCNNLRGKFKDITSFKCRSNVHRHSEYWFVLAYPVHKCHWGVIWCSFGSDVHTAAAFRLPLHDTNEVWARANFCWMSVRNKRHSVASVPRANSSNCTAACTQGASCHRAAWCGPAARSTSSLFRGDTEMTHESLYELIVASQCENPSSRKFARQCRRSRCGWTSTALVGSVSGHLPSGRRTSPSIQLTGLEAFAAKTFGWGAVRSLTAYHSRNETGETERGSLAMPWRSMRKLCA
jgi:hypothetical protein